MPIHWDSGGRFVTEAEILLNTNMVGDDAGERRTRIKVEGHNLP